MAYTLNGTSDYWTGPAGISLAFPFSIGCFFKKSANNSPLVSVEVAGLTSRKYEIGCDSTAAFGAYCISASLITTRKAVSSVAASTSSYDCIIGAWNGTASRTIYHAGAVVTNTDSLTGSPGTCDVWVGVNPFNTAAGPFAGGDIAEIAIWNVDVGSSRAASAQAGYSFQFIRPDALLYYWDLINGVVSKWNGLSLSVGGGSPTRIDHPRIYFPNRSQVLVDRKAALHL